MACTIKTKKLITINGGTNAFGGIVSGLTLNMGAGNQSSSASVTVVRNGSNAFTLPSTFDKVTVGVGNVKYKMVVRSYTVQNTATSADSLKVELVDTSYESLDLNIIILNEADRTGGGIEYVSYGSNAMTVHAMGTKWIPKTDEDMFGNILPTPDAQWMKAREYWEEKNWKAMLGLGRMDPLTPAQLEDRIVNESGTILYTAEDVFDTLGVSASDIPATVTKDEKLKFVGTFREVLASLAAYYGFFYWWDMQDDKLKFSTSIDLSEGEAILDELRESCVVTSQSTTTDASSTYAKAAFSQFDNRWTYTSTYGSSPARGVRYHRATLLQSQFKYRKCWEDSDVKAPNLDEFGAPFAPPNVAAQEYTEDQKKAMKAALMGPNIYAAYVIQTLAAANDNVEMPDMKVEFPLPNGEMVSVFPEGVPAVNIVKECPWQKVESNSFLLDVYSNEKVQDCGEAEHKTCGCIWPVNTQPGSAAADALKSTWTRLATTATDPLRGLGFEKVKDKLTPTPQAFFRVGDTGATLFKGSGVDASTDPIYKYLRALVGFVNRFYVVQRGGNVGAQEKYWTAQAGIRRNYSYYIGTTSQPKLSNPEGNLTGVHPALRVDKCGFPEFAELLVAMEYIYTGKDAAIDPSLYPCVLDFTYWLDKAPGTLAKYYAAAGDPNAAAADVEKFFSCTPQTSVEGTNQPKMFFVVLENAVDMNPNVNKEQKMAADAMQLITDKSEAAINLFKENNNCSMYLANTHDLHRSIQPLTDSDLRLNVENSLRCEYTTTSANGNDNTSTEMPYNFYCNWLALPNLPYNQETGEYAKVFAGKFESTSVEAAELGLSNGEHTTFGSIVASPFSPTNKLAMAEVNKTKAIKQSDYDTMPATSRRVSFILTAEDEVDLPLQNEGLEGLSVTVGAEQSTVDVVIGNVTAKKVAKDMATNKLNTAFNSFASQAFSPAEIMFSNKLKFLGIG